MNSASAIRIPFVNLTPVAHRVFNVAEESIHECFHTADFIAGRSVAEFEALLAKACSTREAVACANGTDALILALQAIGIRRGDRVAIPNLTFWATYEAVVHVGAVPVLIDVDPQHFQLSIPELELAHAHEPLQACIVVHLFGWCHPDLELLRDFCKRCGIRLVEDAAQAFGVATKGPDGCDTPIFAGAEISTLSFYPAKVLGGCMDGGAVTTNSPELASCVRTLLNHGREKHYSFKQVGWNSRMSSVQGAYLRAAIQEVPFWIEERRTIMRRYHEQLSTAGFHVVNPPRGITGNGYLAAVLLPAERVAPVQAILAHEGIATGRVYPETIHQQTPATDAPRYSDLRISTEFTTRVLNLPLFPGLSEEEQNEVICTLVHKT